VDWFNAVTVAPGTCVLPDFTVPAMTKFGATADPDCASKPLPISNSGASPQRQVTNTLHPERRWPGLTSEKLNRMNTIPMNDSMRETAPLRPHRQYLVRYVTAIAHAAIIHPFNTAHLRERGKDSVNDRKVS
jgi:hypothetical protein